MRAELRDWDLWGPLFLCMSLAVMLSITAHDEASIVFSVIFVIVWVGAAIITINGQLLGGRLYVFFFFSLCHLPRRFLSLPFFSCSSYLFVLFVPFSPPVLFSKAYVFWGIVFSPFY